MTFRIALLRGVNVGGHMKVSMAELRDMLAGLGLADAQTVLQSGNLIFRSDRRGDELEGLIERAARERLGLHTDVMVRTGGEWANVVASNPFPEAAARDPSHLVVMILKKAPGAQAADEFLSAVIGPETVQLTGSHAYILYPAGIGRSKLTNVFIEGRLGTRGTGRNWNTVLKLAAMMQQSAR